MKLENSIESELEDYYVFFSNKLAKTSIYVYSKAVQKFLRNNPDIDNTDEYINFLEENVAWNPNSEGGKRKRNMYFFDALINYCKFKRSDCDNNVKGTYTKIIKLLRENKPQQFMNKNLHEYLTIRQRFKIIEQLKSVKHQLIAKLCMQLGVRAGSVFKLKTSINKPAIKFEVVEGELAAVIDFYKMKGGKTSRKYVFDKDLINELRFFIDSSLTDSEYFFVDTDRSYKKSDWEIVLKTNYHWYWEDLKNALDICGFNSTQWSTHDFRKNAAHDIYIGTKDPYAVKEFLDHEDFRATEHYLKNEGLYRHKLELQQSYSKKIQEEKNNI
jgi:integrase